MSRLRELMEELCPNGVEYVPLWSVTIWDKKFNAVERDKQPIVENYRYLLANDLFLMEVDKGDVFLLSTGERTGWTTKELAGEYLKEGEVVSIPWGKSRDVTDCIKYYKGKFVTADNRIATSNDITKLSNRYLYYWMMSQGKVIDTFYRGSGIKHPDMAKVLNMQIPIPPLAIQNEIVKLLDDFTELTAELTEQLMTELTLRKKQYNFYLDSLLNFVRMDDTIVQTDRQTDRQAQRISKKRRIGDIATFRYGYTASAATSGDARYIRITDITEDGTLNPFDARYTCVSTENSEYLLKRGDLVMARTGATYGKTLFYDSDAPAIYASFLIKIQVDEAQILPRFYWHFTRTTEYWAQADRLVTKGGQPQFNTGAIGRINIPIPPLEIQQKIVSILDRFDTLCGNLTSDLSAEITARKKQYEHYRDRLLTFPRSKLEERS